MEVRAVFFDAGETLVHPHPSFPELFTLVLRREGHPVDPATVRERIHVVSDEFARAARDGDLWTTSPERSRAFWLAIYRQLLADLGVPSDAGVPEALYATFTDLSSYRLFPDVRPLLERLRAAGLALGVVSNFEAWLERLLEQLGVSAYFDVRVVSGTEGLEKPDPRIFRLAMQRAGAAPDESVYVGDNPVFDVEPAAEVGMLPVLIDRRGRYLDHPGLRIATLDDLPSTIGLLEARGA